MNLEIKRKLVIEINGGMSEDEMLQALKDEKEPIFHQVGLVIRGMYPQPKFHIDTRMPNRFQDIAMEDYDRRKEWLSSKTIDDEESD